MANKELSVDEKRFIQLGWTILEAKAIYYGYAKNIKPKSDVWYDNLEEEYKQLAMKLNKEPSASNYVEFPFHKACGQLVLEKLKKTKKFKYTVES